MDSSEYASEDIIEPNSNTVVPPDSENSVNITDSRIRCANSKSVNNIFAQVSKNISEFSDTLCLGNEKSQFVTRAMEVFKNCIQDNITVNGLPYVSNKNCLSPVEKEEQEQEATAAVLASLAKEIEKVTLKRKNSPKECCQVLNMHLQMKRQRLKSAKIDHSVVLPPVKKESFQRSSFNPQKLEKLKNDLQSSQDNLLQALRELEKLKQNMNFVRQCISNKAGQEILQDTGYISS